MKKVRGVYGEIAHNILNGARTSSEWKEVQSDFAAVGNMASGSERVFHMKTTTPDNLSVSMSYADYKADQGAWEHETDICNEVTQPTQGKTNPEVEIYSIRQSVLELLSDARKWKQQHGFTLGAIALPTPPRMLRQAAIPQPPTLQRQTNANPLPAPAWNIDGIATLDSNMPPATPVTQERLPAPPANRYSSAPVIGSQPSMIQNPMVQDEETTSYNELKLRLDSNWLQTKAAWGDSKAVGISQMLTDDLFIAGF